MGIPRLLKIILPNPDQEILGFPVGLGRVGPLDLSEQMVC